MSVSKKDLVRRIKEQGVIPVFYHSDMDILLRVIGIAYQCGIRVFEFMHQRDNKGLRFFEHVVEQKEQFPDMIFGVGTVLDATMTERYINAGANFISSPFLRSDMAEVCRRHDIYWMPGCSNAAEIEKAYALGATAINVLLGNVLGPEFLLPIARRHRHLSLIPSGINDFRQVSLVRWYEAGASALRVGPQIFTREDVSSKNWAEIAHHLVELQKTLKRIHATIIPLNSDPVHE